MLYPSYNKTAMSCGAVNEATASLIRGQGIEKTLLGHFNGPATRDSD